MAHYQFVDGNIPGPIQYGHVTWKTLDYQRICPDVSIYVYIYIIQLPNAHYTTTTVGEVSVFCWLK
jgi:hypothetical protein